MGIVRLRLIEGAPVEVVAKKRIEIASFIVD